MHSNGFGVHELCLVAQQCSPSVGSWPVDNACHHTRIQVRATGNQHSNYLRLKHHSTGCCRWISTLWMMWQHCFRLPLNARVAYIVIALHSGFAKFWWVNKRRRRLAKFTIAYVRQCVVSDGRTTMTARFPLQLLSALRRFLWVFVFAFGQRNMSRSHLIWRMHKRQIH